MLRHIWPHTSLLRTRSAASYLRTVHSSSIALEQAKLPLPKKTTFDQFDPKVTAAHKQIPATADKEKLLQEQHDLKASAANVAQDQAAEKVYVGLDGELHPEGIIEEKTSGDSGFRMTDEMLISSIPGPKALTIRGVVFDTKGTVTQLDQEFQRAQICSENTLQPRDLRKLDSSLSDQSQVILVREKAVLVNLYHVRALIRADRVIIVQSPSDSLDNAQQQSAFIYELQGKLQIPKDSTVFEIKVMEAILTSVSYGLQQDLHEFELSADILLASLDASVDGEKLKQLLLLRRSYNKFLQRVEGFRTAVNELLNNDEDLAGLYLTDKSLGIPRATADHIEMELMLEHYVKIGDDIVSRIQETTSNLQTTQHMIGITLDNTRNQLIVFDLQANLATAAISSAALVAGLLGMNLPNGIDTMPWIFPIVSIAAVGLAKAVYFGSVKRMGKIIQWKGLLGIPPPRE